MARAASGDRERRGFWFSLAIALIRPSLLVLTRRERRGLEHVPARGGALVVANHISAVDPLTVAHAVYDAGRLPHYLAKDSLFGMFFVGRIMRGARQIPVKRDTADAAHALSAAVQALRSGKVVIIYPEGTTSRDPDLWPMKARTGVARLALSADVPVLPLAQWGAQQIHRRGGRLHLLRHPLITTVIGPPIDLTRFAGATQTPAVLREVTDEIMGTVTAMVAGLREEAPPEQPFVWRSGRDVRRTA
ncbi:MAG TPA: lysophospholipid acyltransferase family protein [Mycobacteriales bacterium]|jgi:1-acyl-sn-glycerol-3-phosphate acyltransferase|nr:lysophospholipid acyltransferase family protein [Mycobacteriales bacterium]